MSLDIDATWLLPPDESGYGFDNVTVGDLPPALLDRYISAARKISRLAVGITETSLRSDIIRLPADRTQEEHVAGLPIGTRGGVSVSYTFAQDAEYEIQIRLARDLTGNVGGLRSQDPQPLELLIDREIVETFLVVRPNGPDHSVVDEYFKVRVPVSAGPHDVGITFPKQSSALYETARQPLQSHFNETRHPRQTPAIYQVSITGPYAPRASTTRRAAARYSFAGQQSPARKRRARGIFSPQQCGARTVGRSPTRMWRGRWPSIAKDDPREIPMQVSMRASMPV